MYWAIACELVITHDAVQNYAERAEGVQLGLWGTTVKKVKCGFVLNST
ncbi:MAG: hypothetical protein K6T83_13675 [Alicyclobacillus sp.]|nr:hypothetical protein [Alicyclobacillus sp.]